LKLRTCFSHFVRLHCSILHLFFNHFLFVCITWQILWLRPLQIHLQLSGESMSAHQLSPSLASQSEMVTHLKQANLDAVDWTKAASRTQGMYQYDNCTIHHHVVVILFCCKILCCSMIWIDVSANDPQFVSPVPFGVYSFVLKM